MANWKLALLWIATIAWRLGSSAILVAQGKESELKHGVNWLFWLGYIYLWVFLQDQEVKKEAVWGEVLYLAAWVFLVAITGLALRFLIWVLLQIVFDIKVSLFWGEVFAVVFSTICLYIPVWLRRNTINSYVNP